MSPGLHVMFVLSSTGQGGAERQSLTLLNRLAERGHECSLTVVKPVDEDLRLGDGRTVSSLRARRYLDWQAVRRCAAEIAAERPAVVVAVNPYALMYAELGLPSSGPLPRLVVTYHTTRPFGLKERLQTLAYRPLFWRADCAVFVCAGQRRYWRRRGMLARRNEVIYNGVDIATYSDAPAAGDNRPDRPALGLDAFDYVIGIAAWLRPEKNHVQLVDALAALRRRGIPARVLMIGDGAMRGAVECRARDLGVAEHVVITGAQADVRPFVAMCDVIAICSVAIETFSLAALEAMAMSKPVVHSDLGGASEMIEPGHSGFLFPVGDTDALVAQLIKLSERSTARQMGANARAAVRARFSESAMVDRYERLLLDIARIETRQRAGRLPPLEKPLE